MMPAMHGAIRLPVTCGGRAPDNAKESPVDLIGCFMV